MKTKMENITALLITVVSLIIIAGFTACDDGSVSGNDQNTTNGRLTIFFYSSNGSYVCARGVDVNGKTLFAAGAKAGNAVRCVPISQSGAVLNVWEVKTGGTFSSFSGTGVAELEVFILEDPLVTYDEIMALDFDDLPGYVFYYAKMKPFFNSGKGAGLCVLDENEF